MPLAEGDQFACYTVVRSQLALPVLGKTGLSDESLTGERQVVNDVPEQPAQPVAATVRTRNKLFGNMVQLLRDRLSPNNPIIDINRLPRGGPNASWLDRALQTDRLEYLDREDIADDVKQEVHRIGERLGRILRIHDHLAHIALAEVSDVTEPRILELGAGPGALSRRILELSPGARTTVTDTDPVTVANLAATQLGSHPRATVRVMDATAIDAPDHAYDLAVLCDSLHHFAPARAAQVFAEGTRVARKLLIIDVIRLPPALLIPYLAMACLLFAPISWPYAHDAVITLLRAYSPSALRALAVHAGHGIEVQLRRTGFQITTAERAFVASVCDEPRTYPTPPNDQGNPSTERQLVLQRPSVGIGSVGARPRLTANCSHRPDAGCSPPDRPGRPSSNR